MPYRIDLRNSDDDTLDRLLDLGALDVEPTGEKELSALLPDSVPVETVASALGIDVASVSPVPGRDDGSVWILGPRAFTVGPLRIAPASADPAPGMLRLHDTTAFGTGLHPTTALCIEEIAGATSARDVESLLDVGTGSGVLALGALVLGLRRATAIDLDGGALQSAVRNAHLNELRERVQLVQGGPAALRGQWPLVVANVLAAPLIEMASTLVQRVGHRGELVLSGIRASAAEEVARSYVRLGMHRVSMRARGGWVVVILRSSW